MARTILTKIFNKLMEKERENAFTYLAKDVFHIRHRSTNFLKRLNQEVRRQEKVIRIFPNEDSAIRLIISPSAFGDQSSLISMRPPLTSSKLYIRTK